jgi:[ribosomal protein S18]-alanine N-acetyltransferase
LYCESEQLLLREAGPGDAGTLAAIDQQVSVRPLSKDGYQRICQSGAPATGLALVIECAGRICGFSLYTQVLDEGSISNIAVDPAYQGRGFGRQLLQRTLAVMQQAQLRRCLLEVRASNDTARALYESEGFTLDGMRRGYYSTLSGEREDALLMSRLL